MYMVVSFDCKFKGNQENIERTLQHFGLRKVQGSLYVGEMENSEREMLVKKINESVNQKDSVLIVPICQSCFSKGKYCGRKIKFKSDLYRVY